jgi:hypothetical protein
VECGLTAFRKRWLALCEIQRVQHTRTAGSGPSWGWKVWREEPRSASREAKGLSPGPGSLHLFDLQQVSKPLCALVWTWTGLVNPLSCLSPYCCFIGSLHQPWTQRPSGWPRPAAPDCPDSMLSGSRLITSIQCKLESEWVSEWVRSSTGTAVWRPPLLWSQTMAPWVILRIVLSHICSSTIYSHLLSTYCAPIPLSSAEVWWGTDRCGPCHSVHSLYKKNPHYDKKIKHNRMIVSAFCHRDKIPKINNLKGEKVYFVSLF